MPVARRIRARGVERIIVCLSGAEEPRPAVPRPDEATPSDRRYDQNGGFATESTESHRGQGQHLACPRARALRRRCWLGVFARRRIVRFSLFLSVLRVLPC